MQANSRLGRITGDVFWAIQYESLPIRPKIPVSIDVSEDGMARLWCLILVLQTGDLVGRLLVHPAKVDVLVFAASRCHTNQILTLSGMCPPSTKRPYAPFL